LRKPEKFERRLKKVGGREPEIIRESQREKKTKTESHTKNTRAGITGKRSVAVIMTTNTFISGCRLSVAIAKDIRNLNANCMFLFVSCD
jgi:hypothetical protein